MKRKDDQKNHTINLDKDDMGFLIDAITEVAKTNLEGLSTQQMQVANRIIEHVNRIMEAINEVKTTVEAETYDIDPCDTLATPLLLLPLNLELKEQALESGSPEYDDVI